MACSPSSSTSPGRQVLRPCENARAARLAGIGWSALRVHVGVGAAVAGAAAALMAPLKLIYPDGGAVPRQGVRGPRSSAASDPAWRVVGGIAMGVIETWRRLPHTSVQDVSRSW